VDFLLQDAAVRSVLQSKGLTDNDIDNYVYLDVSLDSRLDLIQEKYGPNFSEFIYKTHPRPNVWYATPFWNDNRPDTTAAYLQPIDEIIIFFNKRDNQILKIYDNGENNPIAKGNVNWDRPLSDNLKPILTTLPEGPSYTLNQNEVEWADWKFTWSVDPVYGVSLYNVSILDRTVWKENPELQPVRRNIVYKANVSELITAYGNNSISGTVRNYFDISEYPFRDTSVPQVYGIDVPPYADLLGFFLTYADGTVAYYPQSIAIYERESGMLWRHTDDREQGRMGRELVVSWIITVGNYDYSFYWIFTLHGQLTLDIHPSGVIETNSSKFPVTNDSIEYGQLVLPYVIGLNHTHLASVRLDVEVDGLCNTVEESDVLSIPASKNNPYGNLFTEQSTLLRTEQQGVRDTDFTKSRKWVIKNKNSLNYLGFERSYELVPFPTSLTFNDKSRVSKRANYTRHSLFVTKYHDDELYAVGKYPVEKGCDSGLGKYIKDNENIVNEDIVLWYTFGFSHAPICEDVPVMCVEKLSMTLRPENFFNENNALYIQNTKIE
jgi:primary-amine oxidase